MRRRNCKGRVMFTCSSRLPPIISEFNQSENSKGSVGYISTRSRMETIARLELLLTDQLSAERNHGTAALLTDDQLQESLEKYHLLSSQLYQRHVLSAAQWDPAFVRRTENSTRKTSSMQARKLSERVFSLLCAFVTHHSPPVRSTATRGLGSFPEQRSAIALQTLSKAPRMPEETAKLPSQKQQNPKKSRSSAAVKLQKLPVDLFAAEGDVGLTTSRDFGVVEQTTCGVFVLAMEDEFEQVRLAAIESIRKLGLASLQFAQESCTHLIGT